MDKREAGDIKNRWQEYQEELYKNDLHDPDNHNGVIIHLQPDIWECEAKWALGSITTKKASGGDGIPVELFQILKEDAVKVISLPIGCFVSLVLKMWTREHNFLFHFCTLECRKRRNGN